MRSTQGAAAAITLLQVAANAIRRDADNRLLQCVLTYLACRARDPGAIPAPRRQDVTAMFCDIANYSSLSERVGPDASHRLVTDILERITACVDAEGGSIVDFYGDGMLVMWNAPKAQADHADRACRTALAIQGEIPDLSETWAGVLAAPLQLRCTINTGHAVVGNTGTVRHSKYGPMGHTINLAQRVQTAAKFFQLPVVITAATRRQLVEPLPPMRRLGRTRLTGMAESTELFELLDRQPTEPACRSAFEEAMSFFERGQWCAACLALHPTLQVPQDRLDLASLHLLGRAVECLKSPPTPFSADWDLAGK